MVRLRLRRVGRKKQPSYRLVAADREAPRDGRFLEVVGFYNPRTEPSTITLKEDRIFDWLSKGAQPSDAVESLFRQMGTRDRFERFKAGEEIEKLLEEYQEVEDSRNVSPKTRQDETKKKPAKAAKPAAEAEVKAEPAVEEEAEEAVAETEEAAVEETAAEETAAEEPPAEEPAAEVEEPVEEEAEEAVAEAEEAAVEETAAEEPAAEEPPAEEPTEEAEEPAEEEAE
jgi:small subunit ribosomal protein S16